MHAKHKSEEDQKRALFQALECFNIEDFISKEQSTQIEELETIAEEWVSLYQLFTIQAGQAGEEDAGGGEVEGGVTKVKNVTKEQVKNLKSQSVSLCIVPPLNKEQVGV